MNRLLRRASPPGVGQARNDGVTGGFGGMDWRKFYEQIASSCLLAMTALRVVMVGMDWRLRRQSIPLSLQQSRVIARGVSWKSTVALLKWYSLFC